MKIKTFEYQRKEVEIDIPLPEETVYFFETGIRRSVKAVPVYTAWLKDQGKPDEEIYEYSITCVYGSFECKIEKFKISISDIPGLWAKDGDKSSLLRLMVSGDNKRTKERFDADLDGVLDKISKDTLY